MKVASERPPSAGGWVVLGLLLDAPMSGYDLSALAQRSVGQFWPVTKAHIYGELPRLERLGFVAGKDVAQHGAPDKRVYSATKQGRAAFKQWLASSEMGDPLLRHPLLVQIFFGAHLPPNRLRAVVAMNRQRVIALRDYYCSLLSSSASQTLKAPDAASVSMRRLAIRHAQIRLEAELKWLSEVEASI